MTEIEAIQAVTREQVGKAFIPPVVPRWKVYIARLVMGVIFTAVLCELVFAIHIMFSDAKAFMIMTLSIIGVMGTLFALIWAGCTLEDARESPTTAGEVGE